MATRSRSANSTISDVAAVATTPPARDYAGIAERYARDVTKGKIPAGKMVRLQCQRFLDELKLSRTAAFPYRFDKTKADRVCKFIERLPHSKGKWAAKRERIVLEPWQVFAIAVPFGWVHKAGNRKDLRRFRLIVIVVPRKNGKSAIAAGIGLYMLCADGEAGAEVYSGATSEGQAWEVLKPARLMAQKTPALCAKFGVTVNAKNLTIEADGSKFETLIGDPGDGQSPSCAIHDEYHEHKDDGQVSTMETGMGARDQPIQLIITTAGENLGGPCYALILDERKKLAGIGHNGGPPLEDETFYLEHAADPEDDWKSEAALLKANPNFDVSVGGDYLRARQRDAINTPRKRGIFKTKHLNQWVASKSAFFDIEAWRRCHSPDVPIRTATGLDLEQYRGRRAIGGLDLASKVDIAAFELLILPLGEKATADDPYIRVGRYFLPSERISAVPTYSGWDAEALFDVTDGNIIDYDEIFEAIIDASKVLQLEQLAYDPHQATMLVTKLQKEGVPVIEFRPTVVNFSEPMKELDAAIKAGRIQHGGCKIMEWQMSNVVAQMDAKDNVYPRKPRDEDKIDNPVALISTLGVALAAKPVARSFWEVEPA